MTLDAHAHWTSAAARHPIAAQKRPGLEDSLAENKAPSNRSSIPARYKAGRPRHLSRNAQHHRLDFCHCRRRLRRAHDGWGVNGWSRVQREAGAAATAKPRLRCFGRCDHSATILSRPQNLSKHLQRLEQFIPLHGSPILHIYRKCSVGQRLRQCCRVCCHTLTGKE
jgi:hypothetical protein